jgi:hypothetical protein
MSFTDFTIRTGTEGWTEACRMTKCIKPTTTVKEFSKTLDLYALRAEAEGGYTVLAKAAEMGNVALIEHIVNIGGKVLLLIGNNSNYWPISPLHCACKCVDLQAGFFAAKKLIQLGTSINLVGRLMCNRGNGYTLEFTSTPLEKALELGCTKIAAMLLRLGGIFRNLNEKQLATLEEVKKELMNSQELLFKMQMTETQGASSRGSQLHLGYQRKVNLSLLFSV